MKSTNAHLLGYLLTGAINTATSFCVFVALLRPIGYTVAYVVAFCSGIAISLILNSRFVFRSRVTGRRAAIFSLAYFGVFLVGLAVITICIEWFRLPELVAIVASMLATISLGFLATKGVLQGLPG